MIHCFEQKDVKLLSVDLPGGFGAPDKVNSRMLYKGDFRPTDFQQAIPIILASEISSTLDRLPHGYFISLELREDLKNKTADSEIIDCIVKAVQSRKSPKSFTIYPSCYGVRY
eukprot:Trichotokara_eunicae@DN8306_c0_g1_i1.p1